MEKHQIFVLMWMIANVFSFVPLWFLIAAIVRSKRARGQKFNIYLIFSILSDVLKNSLFFVCNLVNFLSFKQWACVAIGWGEVFYTCSNYWMGAVVTREIYKMLTATKNMQRVASSKHDTTWRTLFLQVTTIHVLALIMASTFLETSVDWIPDISLETGCEAFPTNTKESYYFWCFYAFLGMMVPTVYVLYTAFEIYRKDLLPLTGKTRALVLYFFRLIAVFVGFWIVFVVAIFLKGWYQAIAFVIFNLTGFVSFCFALTKPDVKEACTDLLFCRNTNLKRSMTQSTKMMRSSVDSKVVNVSSIQPPPQSEFDEEQQVTDEMPEEDNNLEHKYSEDTEEEESNNADEKVSRDSTGVTTVSGRISSDTFVIPLADPEIPQHDQRGLPQQNTIKSSIGLWATKRFSLASSTGGSEMFEIRES